ncbi:MAG TPA: hypothetical protein VN957_26000 [Chthoniobacterales bacterium]|nr:hypothetical protein [Chthoniobacterales bacterium]
MKSKFSYSARLGSPVIGCQRGAQPSADRSKLYEIVLLRSQRALALWGIIWGCAATKAGVS